MSIPKAAIEKAIEGKWKNAPFGSKSIVVATADKKAIFGFGGADDQVIWLSEIALDPSFWQALGKALGWNNPFADTAYSYWTVERKRDRTVLLEEWQTAAHSFYNLMLTGQSTKKYWKDILDA